MKKKKLHRLFSIIMALAMVFTMLAPMNASANEEATKPFKQNRTSESILQAKSAIAEQLNVLSKPATLHKDLQDLSGNQEVSVIVQLSENPVALEKGIKELAGKTFTSTDASTVKTKVNAQQSFIKKEMNVNKIVFKEGFSYSTVLNGFSATVKADDLKKLLNIKGVVLVEPVVEVHAYESTLTPSGTVDAAMDTSISFLGIEQIWDKGFKGEGIKVGVLDTGIDYNHPDFAEIYKGGWNFIPHKDSDYARPRADNDPYETTPLDRPANKPEFDADGDSFYTSHGTHVAGTIAAIGANEYGINGIAPKVDLHAYRVLGAYGSGTNAGVIAGINKAVEEGMDIINLSLGGGNNSSTTADTIAIDNAMLAGTLAVLATGNSGPGRGTIGTPAAAALGLAVGNTTNPEANYDANVSVTAGAYTKTSNIKLMGSTYGIDIAPQLAGEFDIVAVPNLGAPKDYVGLNVDGKFVLVSRGEIAFVDKIAAAKAAGAAGMLIHNFSGGTNAPGPSGTFLGDDFEFLPTFDMSQTEGDALRVALAANPGKVSFADINKTTTVGDEVNSSSSRGPTTPHFDIKPDVSAPGTNIMSTIPMYGKDYSDADYSKAFSRKTGTSMATPHIAGIAALVMNANPEWTPFDVKVAISNTAKVLDTTKYDVFAQGPGRIQPYEAAFPKALAYAEDTVVSDGEEVDNIKGTVTFGRLNHVKDSAVSVTKQVRVKNLSGGSSDYTATVQVTKSFANAKITIDNPSFTLNGEQLLNITLTAPQTAIKAGDELLGYIHITNGETKLSLPFAADFSPEEVIAPVTKYELTETDLSFNDDGVKDAGRLEFTLNRNVATNYVELWDIMDPEGGYYEDGYIGYLHAGDSLPAGSYYLDIDGEYVPWGGDDYEQISDGIYMVDFTAENLGAGPFIIEAWDGPLFVKSTPALIEAEETHEAEDSTYEFSGQVVDNYILWQEELDLYGLGYNINTKLPTTYETKDEEDNVVSSGPVTLDQDGSFTFDATGLADGDNTVTIFVNDAAGNQAEETFTVSYDAPEVEPVLGLTVSPENLSLKVGNSRQLKAIVAEEIEEGTEPDEEDAGTIEEGTEPEEEDAGTIEEGTEPDEEDAGTIEEGTDTEEATETDEVVTEKDVTAEATYTDYDEGVITVSKTGLVTAIGEGNTTITVTYENLTATVNVTVEKAPVVNPPTDPVDPTPPTVPSQPTVDPGKVIVDDNNIANQVKDAKTTTVEVIAPAPTAEKPQVQVEVSATSLAAIAQSGKMFVVKAGSVELTVPSDILKELAKTATGKTIFSIGIAKDYKVPGNGTVVSDVYEFQIEVEKDGKTAPVTSFSKQIEISVPVTSSTVKDKTKVATYFINEKMKVLEYVNSKYSNGKATFKTNHFSKFAVVEHNKVFTDIKNNGAKEYIESLAAKSIIKGKTEDLFGPHDDITRAQFTVLLARMLNLPMQDFEGTFSDVTREMDWMAPQIEAANRAGIVVGNGGKFEPNKKITRQQMATMIIRVIEYNDASVLEGVNSDSTFADEASISQYAKSSVALAAGLGIIRGKEVNGQRVFSPNENATRAHAAIMLYFLLEIM